MRRLVWLAAPPLLLLALAACPNTSEGLDPTSLPEDVRPDYAVFAQRCSKCHSIARPLTSGIDDDEFWKEYVARMRRQPASGISEADSVVILRFLHYFSIEERRKKEKPLEPAPAPPPSAQPPATVPAPVQSGPAPASGGPPGAPAARTGAG
jgi:hypothetical protein